MKFFALWMFTHDQADDLMVQSVERGRAVAGEGMSGGPDAFTDGFMAMVAEEKARLKEQIASGKAEEAASPRDERLDEVRFEVAELRGRMDQMQTTLDAIAAHSAPRGRESRVRAFDAASRACCSPQRRAASFGRVSGSRPAPRAARRLRRRMAPRVRGAGRRVHQARSDDLGAPRRVRRRARRRDGAPARPRRARSRSRELAPIIEESLGAPVSSLYASIDETPLATASVAQVHAAVLACAYRPVWGEELPAGAEVVVKVIRPGAAEALRSDVVEARRLAGSALARRLLRGVDLDAMLDEFARSLERELDLRVEGRVADRFAFDFRPDPKIVVPRIVWPHALRACSRWSACTAGGSPSSTTRSSPASTPTVWRCTARPRSCAR